MDEPSEQSTLGEVMEFVKWVLVTPGELRNVYVIELLSADDDVIVRRFKEDYCIKVNGRIVGFRLLLKHWLVVIGRDFSSGGKWRASYTATRTNRIFGSFFLELGTRTTVEQSLSAFIGEKVV